MRHTRISNRFGGWRPVVAVWTAVATALHAPAAIGLAIPDSPRQAPVAESAAAPPAAATARVEAPAHSLTPGEWLTHPAVRALDRGLNADGYRILPLVAGAGQQSGMNVTAFVVDPTGAPKRADANDARWGSGVRLLACAVSAGRDATATVEVRLADLGKGAVALMYELRPLSRDDIRVRVADLYQNGEVTSEITLLGRTATGEFLPIEQAGPHSWRFVNGGGAAPDGDGFWGCMKNCFLGVQLKLTLAQSLAMATCLLAAGGAALAAPGAGAGIVFPCLTAVGLAFVIARAGNLVACLAACL